MELLKPKIKDYPGQLIELMSDNPDLDFAEAKDLAKQKAKETYADPMLQLHVKLIKLISPYKL